MTSNPSLPLQPQIVIVGTGIIGLSTAYYLTTLSPHLSPSITLLDSSPQLFHCASGRAGGFLARDWFSSAASSLGALSFDLHRQLAHEFNGAKEWGYVPSLGISVVLDGKNDKEGVEEVENGVRGEDWLFDGTSRVRAAVGNGYDGEEVGEDGKEVPWWFEAGSGAKVERMSDGETTAAVNPLHLCQFLLKMVKERGVTVHHPATVSRADISQTTKSLESITFSTSSTLNSAQEETLNHHTIPCSHLLISSGVWSPIVFKTLFPNSRQKIPITSLSGHHILIRPSSPSTSSNASTQFSTKSLNSNLPSNLAHTVFVTPPPSSSSNPAFSFSPEIFARSNGDIYFAGLNSSTVPLPPIATDVSVIPSEIHKLEKLSSILIPDAKVVSTGLCHRPVTSSGKPILARIRDEMVGIKTEKEGGGGGGGGVFIAAGHGPWGISMSLGTGKVMAEMMLGMKLSANVNKLGFEVFK